jgi:hypothetical protein
MDKDSHILAEQYNMIAEANKHRRLKEIFHGNGNKIGVTNSDLASFIRAEYPRGEFFLEPISSGYKLVHADTKKICPYHVHDKSGSGELDPRAIGDLRKFMRDPVNYAGNGGASGGSFGRR